MLEKINSWEWDPVETQWTESYNLLKDFILKNNQFPIKNSSKNNEQFLPDWASRQRLNYKRSILSKEKISLLENLRYWDWDPVENQWQIGYKSLKNYLIKHNNFPSSRYIDNDDFKLGRWIDIQRKTYKLKKLPKEKILLLEQLPNWAWDVAEAQWHYGYELLKKFEDQNHYIPLKKYVENDGYRLGSWCSTQRTKYNKNKLVRDRIDLLEKIKSWDWDPLETQWNYGYNALKEHKRKYNKISAREYVRSDGFHLGNWITQQRYNFRKGLLSEKKIKLLETISGWNWDPKQHQWQIAYKILFDYVNKNKIIPPQSYITDEGFKLGNWISGQKQNYTKGILSKDRIILLENLKPYWKWIYKK